MNQADELTCKELVELVTDYIEGRLDAGDAGRFRAHLEECEGCAAYVDQMRRTIALTGALTEESLSELARDDLLRAFRAWKLRRSPSPETGP